MSGMTALEVEQRVAAEFAALRSVPDWPPPRRPHESPRDEEYSRVTDPERWLVALERGEAWARAVTGLGLAARSDDPPTTRLVPVRPGAIPLLLVGHVPPAGRRDMAAALEVRAGDPDVPVLESDCHCDACDFGSADLLSAVDDAVWLVLEGGFVHVTLERATVATTRHGWRASGRVGRLRVERVLADARAGRSRHPVVRGAAWW